MAGLDAYLKMRLKRIALREKVHRIPSSSTLNDIQLLIDFANLSIEFEQARRGQHTRENIGDGSSLAINKRIIGLLDALHQLERRKYHLDGPKPDSFLIMRHIYEDPIIQSFNTSEKRSGLEICAAGIKMYEAKDSDLDWKMFCCVTGEFVLAPSGNVAHLVPVTYSSALVSHICGAGTGDRIYQWDNTLIVSNAVKEALENGDLVIVPKDPNERPMTTFQVKVINERARNSSIEYVKDGKACDSKMADLDDKTLTFRNDKRPLLQFLYLRFLLSIIYNKTFRGAKTAWEEMLSNNPWSFVGKYLNKSFLLKCAQEIGDADEEKVQEIYRCLGGRGDPEPDKRSQSRLIFGEVWQGLAKWNQEMIEKDSAPAWDADCSSEDSEIEDSVVMDPRRPEDYVEVGKLLARSRQSGFSLFKWKAELLDVSPEEDYKYLQSTGYATNLVLRSYFIKSRDTDEESLQGLWLPVGEYHDLRGSGHQLSGAGHTSVIPISKEDDPEGHDYDH